MDVHYTPHTLASKLVASAPDLRPLVVADLCAGRGDLLLQAEATWPQAKFAAVDIDRTSVRRLQRLRKNWHIGRCDLKNSRSRSRSSVLRHVGRRISLLLLNPPFSCRGSARLKAHTPHGYMYTSTAMYFLVTSLGYLHESGSAVAVLPHGVLHNQKDSAAWLYIQSRYSVTVVDRPRPGAFPRSSASTVIVRLSPVRHNTANPKALPTLTVRPDRVTVQLTRGCQPAISLASAFGWPDPCTLNRPPRRHRLPEWTPLGPRTTSNFSSRSPNSPSRSNHKKQDRHARVIHSRRHVGLCHRSRHSFVDRRTRSPKASHRRLSRPQSTVRRNRCTLRYHPAASCGPRIFGHRHRCHLIFVVSQCYQPQKRLSFPSLSIFEIFTFGLYDPASTRLRG